MDRESEDTCINCTSVYSVNIYALYLIPLCMYECTYVSMYVYNLCVCMCVCLYVYLRVCMFVMYVHSNFIHMYSVFYPMVL